MVFDAFKSMELITIQGQSSESQIIIGESFKNFKNYLPDKKVFIISDDKVNALYGNYFQEFPLIQIGQSEQIKNLNTLTDILQQLMDLEADRSSFILAIGGGIVCDIAGFVASVYLRGIDFGFISTTLLSQVDASVGGKNGVNFGGFKNMVGVFNQPKFVLCDPEMLKTLDNDDLNCGFAEIVKHTLIADKAMFEKLEANVHKALQLDADFINELVSNSVKIKASIVNKDEKEKGERRKLNLGHTYGHAIEKVLQISHGNAISMGLIIAARLSVLKGLLSDEKRIRIEKLLQRLNLPIRIEKKQEDILNALVMDKKREGGSIHFILLKDIGDVLIQAVDIEELKKINL